MRRIGVLSDRVWHRDVLFHLGAQPASDVLHRLVGRDFLVAHDALEHLRTQQLLRDRALALLFVHRADTAKQLRRQGRCRDTDLRERDVFTRPQRRQQCSNDDADGNGYYEPPLAPPKHRQIVEWMKRTFFHYWILTG